MDFDQYHIFQLGWNHQLEPNFPCFGDVSSMYMGGFIQIFGIFTRSYYVFQLGGSTTRYSYRCPWMPKKPQSFDEWECLKGRNAVFWLLFLNGKYLGKYTSPMESMVLVMAYVTYICKVGNLCTIFAYLNGWISYFPNWRGVLFRALFWGGAGWENPIIVGSYPPWN